MLVPLARLLLQNSRFGQLPRSCKSFLIVRFEQVVESMYLKGTDGILIVGSNKDDVRLVLVQRFEHLKTTHLRHLDIQEDQIGRCRVNRLDRSATISTLTYDLRLRIAFKHLANHLAC